MTRQQSPLKTSPFAVPKIICAILPYLCLIILTAALSSHCLFRPRTGTPIAHPVRNGEHLWRRNARQPPERFLNAAFDSPQFTGSIEKKQPVAAFFNGGEGNRTPVRKVILETFYGRITSFEIPLAGRRRAGLRFGYLFYLWPLQKKTGGAHLPLCHARITAVVLREGTLAHSGSESYSISVSVYI